MSHSHAPQPERLGAGHDAAAPQVAVRHGDRLLCPCCGEVLMHIDGEDSYPSVTITDADPSKPELEWVPSKLYSPWDEIARRQDALAEAAWDAYAEAQDAQREARYQQYLASEDPKFCADFLTQPIDQKVAAYEFPAEDPPQLPTPKRQATSQKRNTNPRPARQNPWRDVRLEEPYSYQAKRYLAWQYYHLKIEDLQLQEKILGKQTKIDRLRSELGGEPNVLPYEAYLPDENVPKAHPHVQVVDFDLLYWMEKIQADGTYVPPPPARVRLHPLPSERHDILVSDIPVSVHERGPP